MLIQIIVTNQTVPINVIIRQTHQVNINSLLSLKSKFLIIILNLIHLCGN